ncbi:MAG: CYTH domain-containing protein [bacterium]|nr:CYTH domain-containing protein [bacterium]
MGSGFETEIKLGLPDEAAWRWVRDRLASVRVVEQTNHFFDRNDRALGRARIGVRLREAEHRLRLTVKGEADSHPDAMITRRIELEHDREPADLATALDQGLRLQNEIGLWRADARGDAERLAFLDRLEAAIGEEPLRTIGSFRNERSIGQLGRADEIGTLEIEVELDRTAFPGGRVDFELEVERSSEAEGHLERTRASLERWLEHEGGIHPFARESKLARFEAILEAGETDPR